MSDYGDAEYEEDGGDWMYVEEYWDEANDLAEHTCPSPMLYGELLQDDYDVHDYWQDIEYISDGGYFEDHKSPTKRKLDAKASSRPKKRRLQTSAGSSRSAAVGPVTWMTQRQRYQTQYNAPLVTATGTPSVSLLKDWNRKFKDTPGLASFPKSDFEMAPSDEPVAGEGFDLGDLQSVAGLLSEEHMETLQEILKAKGMDPAAVQEVLQDLLEGKQRSFDEEEGGGVEDEQNNDEDMSRSAGEEMDVTAAEQVAQNPSASSVSDQYGRGSSSRQLANSSSRGSKRKGTVEDGGTQDSDEGRARRRKRPKDTHYERDTDEGSPDSTLHIARSSAPPGKPSVSSRPSRSTPVVPEDDVPRTRSGRVRRR